MHNIRRSLSDIKKVMPLVVLSTLFFNKFYKQLQMLWIHIRQDTMTKLEHMT